MLSVVCLEPLVSECDSHSRNAFRFDRILIFYLLFSNVIITTDYDNNSTLITLSTVVITIYHVYIYYKECSVSLLNISARYMDFVDVYDLKFPPNTPTFAIS